MTSEDFDCLYEEQRESILALAFHMTGNRTLAEDILQETFLLAWKHRRTFRGDARASTWLYRIAIRTASRIRYRSSTPPLTDHMPHTGVADPAGQASANDDRRRLYLALDTIGEEHRAVLAMLTLRGMTAERIGEILGIPANTVYSRAAAARRRLRSLQQACDL